MISVVVPTLNEAARLPALLDELAREDEAHEVVVADGGSRDATIEIARRRGVRVIVAEPGRGLQLRAGAAASSGDILLFLHADSRFPRGGLARLRPALERAPALVGGNFRLVFDGGDGFSRWLTGFYAWIRRRGLYYGDSGIFVRRAAYDAAGGIPPIAVLEDYAFVRRLERLGPTCCIDEPPLVTSARRFKGRRAPAIVAGWLVIHALYHLGVNPSRLAELYDSARRRRPH